MSYLDEIVKQAVMDSIPEKEKNKMILQQIEDRLVRRTFDSTIDDAITKQVNKAVAEYIEDHPEAFDGIGKVVAEEFEKELNDYGTIRRVVKKFISKATWRYYIERYLY